MYTKYSMLSRAVRDTVLAASSGLKRTLNPYAIIAGATLIWLAAVVSPGPNFLVVSRLTLSRSRQSAVEATFGIALGSLTYAALTMFGLSVLILRFAWLGNTVRVGWW